MALCDRLEVSLATADTTRCRLLEALLHEALDPASGVLEGRNDEGAKRAMDHRLSLILFRVLVEGGGVVIPT